MYILGVIEEERVRLESKKDHYINELNKLKNVQKGSLVYKKINNKKYAYLVYREDGRVRTKYVSQSNLNEIIEKNESKKRIKEALKNINDNLSVLRKMVKKG